MLVRCLGERRVRQIQRALQRGKLTLLCLFLTFIVLRGTIGAGKFGTPEKDFNKIRHRLRPHRSLPHRALVEQQADHTSSSSSTGATKPFIADEGDRGQEESRGRPRAVRAWRLRRERIRSGRGTGDGGGREEDE